MAVAVTFGHDYASAIFYNFSALRLDEKEQPPLEWTEDKKNLTLWEKLACCLFFDIGEDTISLLVKGAVVRTASLAEIETCTIDEGHKGHKRITIAFQAGSRGLTKGSVKKGERPEISLELCSAYDRSIVSELITFSQSHDGSIKELDDAFPKQTLHHGSIKKKGPSSFSSRYVVLVKWKLYVYKDWSHKHVSYSVNLMGAEITLDPTDDTVIIIHTEPLPLYMKGYDAEDAAFWLAMLRESATMDIPGMDMGDDDEDYEEPEQEVEDDPEVMDPDAFALLLQRIIDNDPELEELDFSDETEHLSCAQALQLADALVENTVITKIDVSMCDKLGVDGNDALITSTAFSESMKEVVFMNCELGDAGAALVGDRFRDNETITSMDLSYNRITSKGVPALGELLHENRAIASLELTGNDIADLAPLLSINRGASSILADNTALTGLFLGSNPLTSSSLDLLAKRLSVKVKLRELNLEDVTVGDAQRKLFMKALKVNPKLRITGVDPPIVQSSAEAEPEPEPKERKIRPPNFLDKVEVDDTPEWMRVRLKKVQRLDKAGPGEKVVGSLQAVSFLSTLKAFRNVEKAEESGEPLGGDDMGGSGGGYDSDHEEERTFGAAIAELETVTTEDGQLVPKVLVTLKKWLVDGGGIETKDIFKTVADDAKVKRVKAQLNKRVYRVCNDVHCCAQLLLDFFREYPGGILGSVPAAVRQDMDDDEGALSCLSELPTELQESLTLLVEVGVEIMRCDTNDVTIETLASVFAGSLLPVPSEDHAQLFFYHLLEYWQENT